MKAPIENWLDELEQCQTRDQRRTVLLAFTAHVARIAAERGIEKLQELYRERTEDRPPVAPPKVPTDPQPFG